jgi:hypothetical protein
LAVTNDNLAWSLIIVGSAVFAFGVFLVAKALFKSMALEVAKCLVGKLLKAFHRLAREQVERVPSPLIEAPRACA